jgi:site-specific recombinase XerD
MAQRAKIITSDTRPFKRYESWYKENTIRRGIEAGMVTEGDADRIREYLEKRKSEGTTEGYLLHAAVGLVQWGEYLSPFDEITAKQITKGTGSFTDKLSPGTVGQRIKVIKSFCTWMINQGYARNLTHEQLRQIKIGKNGGDKKNLRVGDILTPAEVLRIIERGALNTRDRAIVALLYESGCRIQEACTLKWSDLVFDEYGVQMNVEGKTGKPRYVRLSMATEYLTAWKRDYPRDFEAEGKGLVFVTHNAWKSRGISLPMTYEPTRELVMNMASRAGIKKKITPHLFRHSRITHLMQQGYPESTIKMMMWGSLKTTMFATYAHLDRSDTDRVILQKLGIIPQEGVTENPLAPRQCPACKTINGPDARYCSKCGVGLIEEARVSQSANIKKLLEVFAGMTPEEIKEIQNRFKK